MKLRVILVAAVMLSGQLAFSQSKSISTSNTRGNSPSIGLSLDPIWTILGGLGARAEYFVTDRASIELAGVYIGSRSMETSSTDDDSVLSTKYKYLWSYNEVSLGSNIMLTGTHSTRGLYLHPHVGYQNTKITDFGTSKLRGSMSAPFAGASVGYQWVPGGVKLTAGGGLRAIQSSDIVIKDANGKEVLRDKSSTLSGLALDFKVGFMF